MQDTQKAQSEQDSLKIIKDVAGQHQTADPSPPPETELQLDEVALPEITDEFNAKKKVRRSIPFQLVFFGTFVLGFLSLVRGCTTMSESNSADKSQKAVAAAPLEEGERQELKGIINEQNLMIQQLKQGNRIDIRTGKGKTLPKPSVNSATVNRVNTPTRRTPPPATARSIPVRRSAPVYRPRAAQPKVVYKDRVVYKSAPAQPKLAAKPQPQPVSRISLSRKHEPVAQTQPQPIKIKRSPYKPVPVSTPSIKPPALAMKPTAPVSKPQLTSAESGVLVASNAMTGDLLKDMAPEAGANQPASEGAPSQTSLVSGSIPAGTKVKAAFANPLTWVAGNEGLAGQRVLLRLKGDLGEFAKKGSTAIGEVISVQGDFAQVQIVEIGGRPVDHVNLRDPEGNGRTQPIAVVQYKDTPYLQAKAKNSGGRDIGGALLRAGLNIGANKLSNTVIGSDAGSVVNSLAPSQRNNSSQGSQIYAFEGKNVEIYFLEGI